MIDKIDDEFSEVALFLKQFCNAGFFFGINMGWTSIEKMHFAYPDTWSEHYNKNGLAAYDPIFRWGYVNTGTKRWSEINTFLDVKNVMGKAKEHGLNYGAVAAKKVKEKGRNGAEEKKHILTAARHDREFSDDELYLQNAT